MEIKKNPKADLDRNSGLYFVIGLTIALFLTWRLLEYKTYEEQELSSEMIAVMDDLKEDVPITEVLKTTPPPPPPAAPEVIEIIEDESIVEETMIESTEVSQETVVEDVMDVEDVNVEEVEEDVSVPFAIIEDVPVYPGCEKYKTREEKKNCFQQKIQEHIQREFDYPETALELNIQGKVFVQFVIDTRGEITSIRSRGPDKILEQEAERIIGLLPTMIPGKQRGRPVKVPYSIPVTFLMR